jgi:hypothetical protein
MVSQWRQLAIQGGSHRFDSEFVQRGVWGGCECNEFQLVPQSFWIWLEADSVQRGMSRRR